MLYQPSHTQNAEQGDDLDLQDFGRAILRKWRTIIAITGVFFLLALAFVMLSAPEFAATGLLYLGDGQTTMPDPEDQAGFLSDYEVVSSVNTQLQMIQAPALLEQAILESGLNAQIEAAGQPSLPYWKWRFADHKSVGVFAPGALGLVAQYAMFADPAAMGGDYQITFGRDGAFTLARTNGDFGDPEFIANGQLGKPVVGGGISLVISNTGGATPPKLGSTYVMTLVPAKVMAQSILGSLIITAAGPAVSPTNIADVEFIWDDPYQATTFVDYLMRDFIQSQLAWKTESASDTENYISAQLQKISAALTQANQSQANYQSQTGIVDVTGTSQAAIAQLNAYQTQRSTILLQQEALQQLVGDVTGKQGNINPYLISQVNDPVLVALSTTLAEAQVKLDSLRAEFTGQATEVRQQVATIVRIQDAIKTLLQNDEALSNKNLANIDTMIAQYQTQLKPVPGEALQVGNLSRSGDVLGTLYGLLMQKEEEAEVSKAATIEDTRILSTAELPLAAASPKPTITLAAAMILGLIFAVGYVMIRRAFTGTFRSDSEIRHETPLPVYGIIPRVATKFKKRNIFAPNSSSIFAESFRFLRYNLYEFPCEHKSRVVVVASASSGDGKTMIAANIAKVLADDDKRVLLIDADFHEGTINDLLKLPAGPGFSEWLSQRQRPQFLKVPQQNFLVMAAGAAPKNPNELLNSQQPYLIFKALREEFDFIIIDSPTLPAFSDVLPLARQADIMLSVVSIDHTLRGIFATHCEMIEGLEALNGIIINNVDPASHAFGVRHKGNARRTAKRTKRSPVTNPVYEVADAKSLK